MISLLLLDHYTTKRIDTVTTTSSCL